MSPGLAGKFFTSSDGGALKEGLETPISSWAVTANLLMLPPGLSTAQAFRTCGGKSEPCPSSQSHLRGQPTWAFSLVFDRTPGPFLFQPL